MSPACAPPMARRSSGDHVPKTSHPRGRAHRAQGRHRHRQVEHAGVRRRRHHLQRGVRPHAQSLEHIAHLRRLHRRRRGRAGDRRGLAGARHRPCRQPAPARHLLLGRGPPALGGPRHARDGQQLCSHRCRCRGRWRAPWPTWRCSSMPWRACAPPIRSPSRRRTGRSPVPSPIRCRRGASPSRRTSAARCRSTARRGRSARKAARSFEELGCIVEEASPDLGDDRGGVPGAAQHSTSWSTASCMLRDPPRPDQARHHLEHRARPEADAEPDRMRPSASAPPCSGAWPSSSRPTICW